MGVGIGAMHYTGMSALQVDALVRYDPALFAASIVVAVLLAILALQTREWISRLHLARLGDMREVAGALILGFAVAATHYTAMASTYCFAAGGQRSSVSDIDESAFAAVIALIASLVLLLALVAVIFDRRVALEVSKRAEAVDSHRQTSEQLFQAQKMEAVGQLTGGVAHDFNNILTIVLANADAILEDETVPPHIARRARQICDAGQKASELTRQLLAFSRKQILKPERSDLGDIVASTGQLMRRTLGEHVVVQTVGSAQLWPTHVDRTQVETSLINLCINARDAMPTGGRITIETRNVTLDRDYLHSQEDDIAAGDSVMLSVTDTGSGMPPGVVKRAFEPFFTTKPVGKGSGLGLSMVYGFIRQSNGHIKIYSEVGHGTTVKMYFPRSAPLSPAAVAPARAEAPPGGHERILVVEDEDAVRAIVGEQLRGLGYDVQLAGDADQALALLRGRRFDLVLTDVVMPGRLNGKDLADEVERSWPGTRVVFMSGYSENVLLNDGWLDSDVMLLAKPHQKSDLARIIRSALSGGGGRALGDAALQG